ncbi:hypothetical protein WN51_08941 [Melipona quadrifasciata]|uniref:Uncharacterized protein n=1 Tax=Melipona quadrifasciata TaxID=166423 RepID=A0A0M8ZPM4_9HYME|nr:hypothetical protein WN51_08941 [Melipona quadrifasciata]
MEVGVKRESTDTEKRCNNEAMTKDINLSELSKTFDRTSRVTAPTYQGREAAQGGNCQLTVINSLSQVAVIKPAISPSLGTGWAPNDPGSASGPIERRGHTYETTQAALNIQSMVLVALSPGRPLQTRGEAGVHGTAMSSIVMLGLRTNGENLDFFGLLGGDSAKVTLLRGGLLGGGCGGGGGGGRAAISGGGGGVGREMAGDSPGLSSSIIAMIITDYHKNTVKSHEIYFAVNITYVILSVKIENEFFYQLLPATNESFRIPLGFTVLVNHILQTDSRRFQTTKLSRKLHFFRKLQLADIVRNHVISTYPRAISVKPYVGDSGPRYHEGDRQTNDYLGDMSQPCCMNAARANQRLLMMLKSFAMLDVGMCGDPCDPCGCCSVGSFLVVIVGSPPLLRNVVVASIFTLNTMQTVLGRIAMPYGENSGDFWDCLVLVWKDGS